ncbi:MAG: tRNA lysidine(34) synthetase TilS [bacterium]|nr:tRNA lysidine(34) synthetase TilS [bacterium]
MKKILVAVSGGVDSVVLLDFLVEKFRKLHGEKWPRENLIVAHFEHGIRGEESKKDLEFVQDLARKNHLRCVFESGNLGKNASEATARNARYAFLRKVAKQENAVIFTAHHKNDLAETFALNLARGGGWRAVAGFDSPDIERPFLKFSKAQIFEMAKKRGLTWREDSTNFSLQYTRNRIRQKINFSEEDLDAIFAIWQKQIKLKREIEVVSAEIRAGIFRNGQFERRFFFENADEVCFEILRQIMIEQSGEIPLSKQVWGFLAKIRTFRNGARTQILGGREVKFSRNYWTIIKTD